MPNPAPGSFTIGLVERIIDSASYGDPVRFLPLDVLETRLAGLPPAPRDAGRVRLLVQRGPGGRREARGDAALRFVSKKELRHLNLRGLYMRVVEDGDIAVGDPLQVLSRPLQRRVG